ncbi:uncharacterized protein LOC116918082 [Daphnia magna]|uniref:uncharacterized protein LOC116918082 n=1 Tax=Daphnia magna TaxID=35525 RepID=UPI001402A2C5|nr:uncharacterized protein LOC116918082 [Daphnia magna]
MRLQFSLLVVVIVVYVNAAAKNSVSEAISFYPFKNYAYNEPNNAEDVRQQMLTMSFVIPAIAFPTRLTVLETLTSTSTIYCTKSVNNRCSNRRRTQRPWRSGRPSMAPNKNAGTERKDELLSFALEGGNYEEQFPILPSAVQRFETTALPTRETRAADPQLFLVASKYYDPKNRDGETGFRSDDYNFDATPFNKQYAQLNNAHRQLFLQNMWTVTRKTTVFEIAIFKSTPACSTTGTIPQCPPENHLRSRWE